MNNIKLSWLLISIGLLGGCGSGGSSDEGVIIDAPDPPPIADLPPTILSTYNFEIGGVQADSDMMVDFGGQFQVGIDLGNTLRGSVDFLVDEPDTVGFQTFSTDAGSTMTVTVAGTNTDLDGKFTVQRRP